MPMTKNSMAGPPAVMGLRLSERRATARTVFHTALATWEVTGPLPALTATVVTTRSNSAIARTAIPTKANSTVTAEIIGPRPSPGL